MSPDVAYTDHELVQLVKQHSEEAFGWLFQRHWEKLYLVAKRRLSDAEVAREVVHDVFMDFWRRRESLQVDNLPAYLGKATYYRIINKQIQQKDTYFFELLENPGPSLYTADEALLAKDLAALIHLWIQALPEKRRQIFVQHYFEHLTVKEIAAQMQISPKTVHNQLSLAIQYLRTHYGDMLPLLIFLHEVAAKK